MLNGSTPSPHPSGLLRAGALIAVALGITGCQSTRESLRAVAPTFIQAYRPDVQQGNVVTREMADQLRQGMTRDQVRLLLGTPVLTSAFHADRWDYVYFLKRGKGAEVQQRRLTVHFENNRLARFSADDLPPEALADNLILGRNPRSLPRPPVSTEGAARPPGPVID
jgi:outer membrane protein assembly factor BamE